MIPTFLLFRREIIPTLYLGKVNLFFQTVERVIRESSLSDDAVTAAGLEGVIAVRVRRHLSFIYVQ